ncbi:IclR family transcriptional regulator [Pseudomaricurvus alkylphenolicus]|jgi:DNA-binding IclR family transcriptional regulator|uniref:IclR family transcriptional regulator n=1 Tax=Pseudomaricurvus alkylphenolicus TaxID=1306991 RepID=UPI00141F2813|nr:IclR family transcriptional regulator [Pseudomaricurvus alkylphenolicus]NIB43642.1 IclR family transcriptional regulator [Pseudomaricurvus alkylphenolicus]
MSTINGLPRDREDTSERKFIEALARGLDVLRAFQPGDGFLGNQEIAERTQLPKSSISRLTYTLTKLGYLTYSERLGKYQLGSGVLALGYAFVSNLAIRQVAKPLMQDLAEATGTAVGLADRDRLEMIYVEYQAPEEVRTFRMEVGDRVPIAQNSAGRAYLAGLSDEEREYLEGYMERKAGDQWPVLKAGIDEAVNSYREHGYCYSFGDWDRDVNGVSVPLVMSEGIIYAFNAGGPAYRLSPDYLREEVAPQLKNMVRNIEAMLIRY